MRQRIRNVEEKHKTGSKTFESLSCKSGLLLSIACCIALIHVELRVQEHKSLDFTLSGTLLSDGNTNP